MINKTILKTCHNQGFDKEDIYEAYKIFFGTLVSESRLRIINLLRDKEMNVSEIVKKLNANQTAISHDLRRLKKCGFVEVKIKGKYRYYDINKETIQPLMKIIDKHMSCNCIHILNESKMKGGSKK